MIQLDLCFSSFSSGTYSTGSTLVVSRRPLSTVSLCSWSLLRESWDLEERGYIYRGTEDAGVGRVVGYR